MGYPEEGTTVAYHRDRGEDFWIGTGETIEDVAYLISGAEHVYVWNGESWTESGKPLRID